jgi:glycerol-3-phosphate dehydrogenase
VLLCEKEDLAQGTSSRSGKLVHGGLRYLEYYEFRLVREALIEREVLLASAPHIIWPMRFVLPAQPGRPARLAGAPGPLPLRPPGRPQAPARHARARPQARPRGRADQGRYTAGSSIPTAGWTTRASWC